MNKRSTDEILNDDEALNAALVAQNRPSIPRDPGGAREALEKLLVAALSQWMSPAEARVQATITRVQFENAVTTHTENTMDDPIADVDLTDKTAVRAWLARNRDPNKAYPRTAQELLADQTEKLARSLNEEAGH